MWFGLLGPLRVRYEDAELSVPAPRQRVLLAALLVQAGRVVSRDELAESVWDGAPPAGERVTLRSYITRLRHVLGPAGSRIVTRSPGYLIEADEGELDLLRFGALCGAGAVAARSGSWQEASGTLASALELWRGAPLADVPSELLQRDQMPRLEQLRLQALEDRIHADMKLGRHLEVIAELEQFASAHPLRERPHGLLMLALYRAGRQADALSVYQRARRHLIDELAVEPGAELRDLHQQILAGDLAGEPAARQAGEVALRGPVVVPHQLPATKPWFVGRTAELELLRTVLDQAASVPGTGAIVTITGPAGVGKTALALRAAWLTADQFPDGQLYVNLRGYNPGGVPVGPDEAICGFLSALQVLPDRIPSSSPAREGLYRSMLARKQVLIVLEDACDSDQVRPLLPGAPGCAVLVTSRAQLTGLATAEGARMISLDVMNEDEAGQLLAFGLGAERAAAEPGALAEMITSCARLPLALTIAGGRAAARPGFPLAVLAAELRDVKDRLDALDAGESGVSVRAAFGWSYQNLTPEAARMFWLLGVHPGPDISAPAAASLAGASLRQARNALAELAQAHLIAEHAPGRYSFHDLLRTYAAEQAAEADNIAEHGAAICRVLDHYLHSARSAVRLLDPTHLIALPQPAPGTMPELLTSHRQALAWLDAERRVLMAAVGAAVESGLYARACQLPAVLRWYFCRRGHWQDWAASQRTALVAACRLGDQAAQARVHRDLGDALAGIGASQEAHAHLQQAVALCQDLGDQAGAGTSYFSISVLFERLGDFDQALRHSRVALDLFQAHGDKPHQAVALNAVGWHHAQLGDYVQAQVFCEQGLAMYRDLGDRFGEAITLDSLGYCRLLAGDHVQAVALYQQSVVAYRETLDRYYLARTLSNLGDAHLAAGNSNAARAAWHQALVMQEELGSTGADQLRSKLEEHETATKSSTGMAQLVR